VVFLAILFTFSRNKVVWAALSIPILAISLVVLPSNTLHRLTMILANPDIAQAHSDEDVGAIESQQERQELMKEAIHYIATRPLTGVGAGEFTDAVWTDEHREGKHPPALGTHNTYLEVASECGLPAFFCYAGIMLASIVINYRTFKRASQQKEFQDAANMAYCMIAVCVGFAVNIFFHHMTYTIYLPYLSGLTVCLAASLPAKGTRAVGQTPGSKTGAKRPVYETRATKMV
jgi:O-antigen ligase